MQHYQFAILYTITCEADATTTITTTTSITADTTLTTTASDIITVTSNKGQVIVTFPLFQDKVTGESNDCPSLAAYCTNKLYFDLMKDKCPKTCGYCNNNSKNSNRFSGTSSCRNALSDCSNKTYFCKNSIYKNFMRTICAAICGYC
uniref:ShKT domain-containing protein n=1 Tax=Strongyloides papillosus TaxID=174720 RepID=A0A0N5BJC5_STREA